MPQAQSGPATRIIVVPSCPSCPPGLRPVFFRNAHGLGGVLPSPSQDGGLEEFCEVCFSRASSSAIRSRGYQRHEHLIRGRTLINGHSRTLPAKIHYPRYPPTSGVRFIAERHTDSLSYPKSNLKGVGFDQLFSTYKRLRQQTKQKGKGRATNYSVIMKWRKI